MWSNYHAALVVLYTVLSAIAVVCLVIGIIMYIFQAIGMYSISKRRKLGTSAFAWIPILNTIKMGQIADDAVLHKRGSRTHFMVLMPVFYIAGGILCCIGYFLILISFNLNTNELIAIIREGGANIPALIRSGSFSEGSMITGVILMLIGYLVALISTVMEYICLYHIFKSCVPAYTVFFVLSLLFVVTIPFFLFAVRKKDNPDFYFDPIPGTSGGTE